jgi:cytochrome c553
MNHGRSLPQIARQMGKVVGVKLAVAMILAACNGNEPVSTANVSAPVTQAQVDDTVHVCTSCHGFAGRSVAPNFPVLAGLQAGYIEAQLKSFRDHQRADRNARTYMWGMAAHSSNALIHEIAIYFSSQKPEVSAPATQAVMAAGEEIFRKGLPAKRILPCQFCHGVRGQGMGAIPRLAGQHPEYIAKQLEYFASNERQNAVMRSDAKDLTEAQIEAVSVYAADQ